MNQPNILDLIKNCDVEWKSLREIVTTITAPSKVKKDIYRPVGEMPIIDQGIDFIAGYTDENYKAVEKGEYVIFGDHSEHIKYVNFSFVQGADGLKILKVKNNVSKYIYYAFLTFYKKELNYKRHWSTAKETLIPLPSLEIQQKIVKILDKFTELEATLEAELTLRKKQYEFYRNQLLTFDDEANAHPLYKALSAHWNGEVVWKSLGEVAEKIYSGGTPKTEKLEYWDNGTIPWMSSGEVNLGTVYATEKFISEAGLKNSSAKLVPTNSIVIALAGQGKTRGKVARTRIDLTTNQSLAALTFDGKKINSDYVFHFLNTQYENLRRISSGEGTRGGLNLQMISNYPIPLPPLAVQQKIVEILDKFDTLTQSISQGLPREIELRRKQYEYYREQLLNFNH